MSTASLLSGGTPNGVRALRTARKQLLRGLAVQIHMLPPREFKLRGLFGALLAQLQRVSRDPSLTGAYKHAVFDAARRGAEGAPL